MAQTAVCNRHHSLDQQLCRWLLLSLDRPAGQRIDHDPGAHCEHARVRREGSTESALKLATDDSSATSPGRITCAGVGRVWRSARASATPWSRRILTGFAQHTGYVAACLYLRLAMCADRRWSAQILMHTACKQRGHRNRLSGPPSRGDCVRPPRTFDRVAAARRPAAFARRLRAR